MDKQIYRVNITYTGKYNNKSGGCMFFSAITKEDAEAAAHKTFSDQLINEGFPKDCFKLEVRNSCMDEVDFYKQHKFNKQYSKMVH